MQAPLEAKLHFLFGRCVNAEAAAVFAAFEDLGLRSTLDAALAAFALVTSLFPFRVAIGFSFYPQIPPRFLWVIHVFHSTLLIPRTDHVPSQ